MPLGLRFFERALDFVLFEDEVRRGGLHLVEGGEALGDEARDLAQVFALDKHSQIVAAAHQVAAFDFVEAVNFLGDGVEPARFLRGYLDLDERLHKVVGEPLVVDDGGVFDDDAALFHALYRIQDLPFRLIEHNGDFSGAIAAILLQDVQNVRFQFFHTCLLCGRRRGLRRGKSFFISIIFSGPVCQLYFTFCGIFGILMIEKHRKGAPPGGDWLCLKFGQKS